VSITLDRLPRELLLRVVGYLSDTAAQALGATSRHCQAALRQDIIAPIRLGESLRWITSMSAFSGAVASIRNVPAQRRSVLLRRMWEQTLALHPALRPFAHAALQTQGEQPPQWLHTASMQKCSANLPTLERILSWAPAIRARFLPAWIDAAKHEGVRLRTATEWRAIAEGLPPAGRLATLCALAAHPDCTNAEHWTTLLDALLAAAWDMTTADGDPSEDRSHLLCAVATACSRGKVVFDNVQPRIALWDAVFAMAGRLAPGAKASVMVALARMTGRDFFRLDCEPRWRALISAACGELPVEDAANVLCALVTHVVDPEEEDIDEPYLDAVLEAATSLPDYACARVQAAVLKAYPKEDGDIPRVWDMLFSASQHMSAPALAILIPALAEAIRLMDDDHAIEPWNALFDRALAVLPSPHVGNALMGLAGCEDRILDSGVYRKLINAAARLSDRERAGVLKAMLAGRTPPRPLWRTIANTIASLPAAARAVSIPALAHKLFWFEEGHVAFRSDTALPPAASDMPCAERPYDLADALHKLSEVIRLLPLAPRAALLLGLVDTMEPVPGLNVARVRWLLREARHLPAIHRHEVLVVTRLARLAAERCRTQGDTRTLVPKFAQAVRSLPADRRASALLWLISWSAGMAFDTELSQWLAREYEDLPALDRPLEFDAAYALEWEAARASKRPRVA
jgi:hypothetical protein